MLLDGHSIGVCGASVTCKRSRCRDEQLIDVEVSPSIDGLLKRTWGTHENDKVHKSCHTTSKILARFDNNTSWVAPVDYNMYKQEDILRFSNHGWKFAKDVDLSINTPMSKWCLPLPKKTVDFQKLTNGIFSFSIEISPYDLVMRIAKNHKNLNSHGFVEFFCGTATLTATVATKLKNGVIKTLDNVTTPVIECTSLDISHINEEFMGAWMSSNLDVWTMHFKWFGFPCQTFSRSATNSTEPLHGRKFKTMWLGTTPEAKRANLMISYIYSVHHFMIQNQLDIGYFCFENPECNFINHPIVRRMCTPVADGGLGARIVHVSYCAFGKNYRKQTVLVTNHPRIIECFEDDKACCKVNGLCEFTGCKHVNLNKKFDVSDRMVECRSASGGVMDRHQVVSNGIHAKEAEPYPEAFCQAITDLVYTKLAISYIRRKYVAHRITSQ